MPGGRSRRLRQARHSKSDPGAAGQRVYFQRLLGGHRNNPRFLRSEPRPDKPRAEVQLFRVTVADLHASALFAREQNQRCNLAPGDHLGWLHYFRCAHRAQCYRRTQYHPERRNDSQQRDHGGRPF